MRNQLIIETPITDLNVHFELFRFISEDSDAVRISKQDENKYLLYIDEGYKKTVDAHKQRIIRTEYFRNNKEIIPEYLYIDKSKSCYVLTRPSTLSINDYLLDYIHKTDLPFYNFISSHDFNPKIYTGIRITRKTNIFPTPQDMFDYAIKPIKIFEKTYQHTILSDIFVLLHGIHKYYMDIMIPDGVMFSYSHFKTLIKHFNSESYTFDSIVNSPSIFKEEVNFNKFYSLVQNRHYKSGLYNKYIQQRFYPTSFEKLPIPIFDTLAKLLEIL